MNFFKKFEKLKVKDKEEYYNIKNNWIKYGLFVI